MPRTRSTSKAVKTGEHSLTEAVSTVGQSFSRHGQDLAAHVANLAKRAQASTSRGAVRAKTSVKAHPIVAAVTTAAIAGAAAYLIKHRQSK